MDYTKLTWKELRKRLESPHDSPDYQKAKDEIWRRLTVVGAVIGGLLFLVAILKLLKS
jgi:hypothetical protein